MEKTGDVFLLDQLYGIFFTVLFLIQIIFHCFCISEILSNHLPESGNDSGIILWCRFNFQMKMSIFCQLLVRPPLSHVTHQKLWRWTLHRGNLVSDSRASNRKFLATFEPQIGNFYKFCLFFLDMNLKWSKVKQPSIQRVISSALYLTSRMSSLYLRH